MSLFPYQAKEKSLRRREAILNPETSDLRKGGLGGDDRRNRVRDLAKTADRTIRKASPKAPILVSRWGSTKYLGSRQAATGRGRKSTHVKRHTVKKKFRDGAPNLTREIGGKERMGAKGKEKRVHSGPSAGTLWSPIADPTGLHPESLSPCSSTGHRSSSRGLLH